MSFKVNSTRAIEVTKLLKKAADAIDVLEKRGGKNKVIFPGLKEKLAATSEMWKEGFDLENFDEWKTIS